MPVRHATTKGLKYPVDGQLRFGGLISTSNEALGDEVFVETTEPIVFYSSLDFTSVVAGGRL